MAMALAGFTKFKDRVTKCVHYLIEASYAASLSEEARFPCININKSDRLGRTPLHIAAIHGLEGVVQLLLAKGADIQAEDLDGNTPLINAIDYKRPVVFKILLDGFGVNILEIEDNYSNNLLIRTLQKSSWECMCLLL